MISKSCGSLLFNRYICSSTNLINSCLTKVSYMSAAHFCIQKTKTKKKFIIPFFSYFNGCDKQLSNATKHASS